jgi:hypothetical protein
MRAHLLRLLTAAFDAVDGSSARHVSAMDVGATTTRSSLPLEIRSADWRIPDQLGAGS